MSNGTDHPQGGGGIPPPPGQPPDPGVEISCKNCRQMCSDCEEACNNCNQNCIECQRDCEKNKKKPPQQSTDDPSRPKTRLVLTYWFGAKELASGPQMSVTFSGRRLDVAGPPRDGDWFSTHVHVGDIAPGSGPVAITARVRAIRAGLWSVTATLPDGRAANSWSGTLRGYLAIVVGQAPPTRMRSISLTRSPIPGRIGYAWMTLVALGVIVGLCMQSLLLARAGIGLRSAFAVSVLGLLLGYAGASAWFVAKHRRPWRDILFAGLCIQGFVAGQTLGALVGLLALGIPVGVFFDANAPGLFLGLAIGRIGCFLAGCCAGRPTDSRWGVWSSDGRVGTRRVPTQLLESLACAGIAGAGLLLAGRLLLPGAVFLCSWAAFSLIRRAEFAHRAERVALRSGVSDGCSDLNPARGRVLT